jgi:hypothetical protein
MHVAEPVIEETIELPRVARQHGCVSLVLKRGYRLLVGEQISLSGMVVLLQRITIMRASPKVAKRCRLSEGYRRKDAWARIGFCRD